MVAQEFKAFDDLYNALADLGMDCMVAAAIACNVILGART